MPAAVKDLGIYVNKVQQDFHLTYIMTWQLSLHSSFLLHFFFQSEVIILMRVKSANVRGSAAARHTHTSSATHRSSALTETSVAGSDLFLPARCSSSSFSLGNNSGGDLRLWEKIENFWVLQLTVLSFVNRACKWKIFSIPIKFCAQYCISAFLGWTKPWGFMGWKLAKSTWGRKSASRFHPAIEASSTEGGNASRLIFVLGCVWIV